MQTKNLIGTGVGLTNIKCGVKLGLIFLLLMIAGCQQHVLISILNESGHTIKVVDYSGGSIRSKTINDEDHLTVISPDPLVVQKNGRNYNYHFGNIPDEFVRFKFRGRVISVELEKDGKLYLLKIQDKSLIRVSPQPAGFPIAPN